MKEFMAMAAFAVMAVVIAVPAMAQDGESTTGEPLPKASADDSLPKAPPADLPKEEPAPEPTPEEPSEALPKEEGPAPGGDVSDETTSIDTGAANDTGDADTNTDTGPGDDTPVTNTDDGSDDDPVEATKDAEATKDEVVNADAKDRKDQKAGRGKDDEDDEDDDDEDDTDDEGGVEQSTDQDVESGDADQDATVINTGDNVNQCVAVLQVVNTGNAVNSNGVVQADSEDSEIELEDGSTINITPRLVLECRQVIRQVVKSERLKDSDARKLRKLLQPRGNAPIIRTGTPGRVGAGAAVPTNRLGGTPKVLSASRAGQPKASTLTRLPRTGGFSGYATVLGLSAGGLLVGGGLVVRRLSR